MKGVPVPRPDAGRRRGRAVRRAPAKPDRDVALLRLLIEARSSDREAEMAVHRLVREHLGKDSTDHPWKVTRLFAMPGREPDTELSRYLVVEGNVLVSPAYSLQQVGFDLARKLADQGAPIRRVQPDLPSSVYAPIPPGGVDDRQRPLGFMDRGEVHLPESSRRSWALDAMRCPQAWALAPGPGGRAMGAGIVVGHPDTGYTPHPELESEALDLSKDRDLLSGDADARDPLERRWWWPLDTPGHGTATGSVIVSRKAGDLAGVAPLATLVPIRTVKSVVQVFDGDVARAIEYARQIGCGVVSMSLGGVGFFSGLGEVIQRAVQDGVIVMAAAGNYVGFVTAPANLPGCLAVAATNARDLPWAGSSHGAAVDVAAPGESAWAASVNWRERPATYSVDRHSGTSFAVAHLAGVAALWLAYHGRDALVARYGRSRLQQVFLDVLVTHGRRVPAGWKKSEYGAGIVDALAMLQAPLPAPSSFPRARRVAPAGRAFDPFDRIRVLVPELTEDELRRRLRELLGATTDRTLGRKLERYGAEVSYLLAGDPLFRSAFLSQRRRAGAAAVARSPMREAMVRSASRSFLREVTRV
jgi:hypothetical protein